MIRWREAMEAALYGPEGFFVRPGAGGPAAHFRTSAHTSPLFAEALLRLIAAVDTALGRPDPLDVVDIGAGRGELLAHIDTLVGPDLRDRLRLTSVELAPRPDRLPDPIAWSATPPASWTGLLLAVEWLDNVPVEVAEVAPDRTVRYVLVDPASGAEALGDPVTGADAAWLARWWPLVDPGTRAEIGRTRDDAWAGAVRRLRRGLAVAVDYGHLVAARPPLGTLTGFRGGREVPPVPDGSCDITAHIAVDAVAATWAPAPGSRPDPPTLVTQRDALRTLGVVGRRPPLSRAGTDPAGYLRALAAASAATELTDPAGLGGHHWLLQPAGIDSPIPPPRK